jgi:hypothetical protein
MAPKVLFLHGWCSDGSSKSNYLKSLGCKVNTPELSNWFFSKAVRTAQEAYNSFQPDVVVGSSRCAAVALGIDSKTTPLILFAPAWRKFGKTTTISKPNVVVIHSKTDDMVHYSDSEKLISNSVEGVVLITVGRDHRLNCVEGRRALKDAIKTFVKLPDPIATKGPKAVFLGRSDSNFSKLYLSGETPSKP